MLVLGVILELVYFVLSIYILQKVWERMPKTIASLSSGAEWVARLNWPAGTTWNIWPQARDLERMGFMEQIGAWDPFSQLSAAHYFVQYIIFCMDTG